MPNPEKFDLNPEIIEEPTMLEEETPAEELETEDEENETAVENISDDELERVFPIDPKISQETKDQGQQQAQM